MDSCFALNGARQHSVAKICNAIYVRWLLAGVTYLRCTVLTSSNKSETAVHFCYPALSGLVMVVSRNVFLIVSALQSIAFLP